MQRLPLFCLLKGQDTTVLLFAGKALMLALAELVPKHPNRHGKGPKIGQPPQPPQAPAAEGAVPSAPSSTVTAKGKAPGAKDKKGKKKR